MERPHGGGVLAGSRGPGPQPASTTRCVSCWLNPNFESSQLKSQISWSEGKLIQLGSILFPVL